MASTGKHSTFGGDSSLNNSMNFGRPQSAMSSNSDDNMSMSGPIIKGDEVAVTFWVKSKYFVRSLWATRQTEQENLANRDVYIKVTLRELITYLFFLTFISIMAFGMVSPGMFLMSDQVNDLFVERLMPNGYTNYQKMVTVNDYWNWLNSVMLSGLFWPNWYNGQVVQPNTSNWANYENYMIGLPRIRQQRNFVNNNCRVPSQFANLIPFCYNLWDDTASQDSNFQMPANAVSNYSLLTTGTTTAWTYNSNDKGIGYQGIVAYYRNTGYSQLLPSKQAAAQIIQMLQRTNWIDRGTRAVFVEFTVYNADVNLFSVVQLAAEMPPSGGIVPSYQVRTVKLLRYVSAFDYFILACEIISVLFVVYYIVEEALELKKLKWDYFKSFWNWLDLIIVVVSILLAAYTGYRAVSVDGTLSSLISKTNDYADFTFLSFCQNQYCNVLACLIFFAYLKIFKYIGFNKTMKLLMETLSRCSGELFCFAIMFFITFFAYAQLGYLLFMGDVYTYKSFADSVFALFRTMLGDFEFDALYRSNTFLGPLFFISYVFFIYFILFQMFLAIINDSYATVKAEYEKSKYNMEIGDYVQARLSRMMERLNLKQKEVPQIQQAIEAQVAKSGQFDFNELRIELKKLGYADAEIQAEFAKYDASGKEVDLKKLQEAQKQQEATSTETTNAPATRGTNYVEYNVLVKRVERAEGSISGIVSKIDTVLQKMELLEKTKAQRREALNSVLETMKALGEDDGGDDTERRAQLENYVHSELEKWEEEKDRPPTSKSNEGSSRSRPSSSRSRSYK